ncbi:hypothetical protein [Reichenbachiella faecimaris]|nr:hypothetical protein [Reichenbachiella faecimaris]
MKKWELLDAKSEYLEAHEMVLRKDFHLINAENFDYAWLIWFKRNSVVEDAYVEGLLDDRSHIRYKMLLDF